MSIAANKGMYRVDVIRAEIAKIGALLPPSAPGIPVLTILQLEAIEVAADRIKRVLHNIRLLLI